MWRIGRTINKKYKIMKSIGCGSFGDVFSVIDVDTNKPYAAKIIFKDNDKIDIAREFELTSRFDCETLIKCHNAGDWEISEGNYYFIIYELGEYDLKTRITGSVLNDDELLQFARDLALGIGYLHERKHVHRDIKPANILWANGRWKIADFGTARIMEQTVVRNTSVSGTYSYMPPEGFEGNVTPAFDIWSYAVVLMQARTGVRPFDKYLGDGNSNDNYNIVKNNRPIISELLRDPIRQIVVGGLEKDFTKRLGIEKINELLKSGYSNFQVIMEIPQAIMTKQGELIIASCTTRITNSTYKGRTDIKLVFIPNSVTEIGNSAFSGCKNLESVTIPNNAVEICEYAFIGCTSLASVTIPDSVTKIGRSAFFCCTSLKLITISNGVTEIGERAFSGCTGIELVTIPGSVTKIGEKAFSGCTGIELVTIPGSVNEICEKAFSNCKGLKSVTISNGVTKIGESAFSGCTDLELVTIPGSVNEICEKAFSNCKGLKSVTISNGVTKIGESAFSGCTDLELVTIPGSVNEICEKAFSNCKGLKSVTISDGVTKIGESAFSGCTDLELVTIPGSVNEICEKAFSNCKGLKSVTISDGVTKIGGSAFSYCACLELVTIPGSVNEIGKLTFSNCITLIIYSNKGSYAEKYANEHKKKFIAL